MRVGGSVGRDLGEARAHSVAAAGAWDALLKGFEEGEVPGARHLQESRVRPRVGAKLGVGCVGWS